MNLTFITVQNKKMFFISSKSTLNLNNFPIFTFWKYFNLNSFYLFVKIVLFFLMDYKSILLELKVKLLNNRIFFIRSSIEK